jgi:hypothetical protein
LLGFGSCLLGAFAVGYVQGIQSVTGNISNIVNNVAGTLPDLANQIVSEATAYVQQQVVPTLTPFLAIGIVLIIGGVALVVRGDKTAKSKDENIPSAPPDLPARN